MNEYMSMGEKNIFAQEKCRVFGRWHLEMALLSLSEADDPNGAAGNGIICRSRARSAAPPNRFRKAGSANR